MVLQMHWFSSRRFFCSIYNLWTGFHLPTKQFQCYLFHELDSFCSAARLGVPHSVSNLCCKTKIFWHPGGWKWVGIGKPMTLTTENNDREKCTLFTSEDRTLTCFVHCMGMSKNRTGTHRWIHNLFSRPGNTIFLLHNQNPACSSSFLTFLN